MVDIFKTGNKQTLTDILNNKEEREAYKVKLLKNDFGKTLISMNFNIPGDIKNNEYIDKGFNKLVEDFKQFLVDKGLKISFYEYFSKDTGPEAYFLIDSPSEEIKHMCIDYEEKHEIGRLLDIDVYQIKDNQLKIIDRDLFKQAPRLCYVCNQPAKECTRNQTHSIVELRVKINELFQEIGI